MRNIIICCDGTGNEIDQNSENISNVLKLFRCLRKTDKTSPRQLVYYDTGIGTLRRPDPWLKAWQDAFAVFGLATGYGLDTNVLSAYEFIVDNYHDGDEIFMFGFSRGAYTVRMVAGLIHKIGLLLPEQKNLSGIGLAAFKQLDDIAPDVTIGTDDALTRYDSAAQFARTASSRWPTIRLVGVWDTVASIIAPRPDRLYFPSVQKFVGTMSNPSVRSFRQAISIDERRRMYRLQPWDEPQLFWKNRFIPDDRMEPQDILQVWFAGVHADIGGGYPEAQSGLSKFPLLWMIEEARKHGLAVNARTVNQLAWGVGRTNAPLRYAPPDFTAEAHRSLNRLWHVPEYLPKSAKYKEWPSRQSYLGFYVPRGEPRVIPAGATIHESVVKRMRAIPDYRPINLPSEFKVLPMPVSPEVLASGASESN